MEEPDLGLFGEESKNMSVLYFVITFPIIFPSVWAVEAKYSAVIRLAHNNCVRVVGAVSPKVFRLPAVFLGFVDEQEADEFGMKFEHLALQLGKGVSRQGRQQFSLFISRVENQLRRDCDWLGIHDWSDGILLQQPQ